MFDIWIQGMDHTDFATEKVSSPYTQYIINKSVTVNIALAIYDDHVEIDLRMGMASEAGDFRGQVLLSRGPEVQVVIL